MKTAGAVEPVDVRLEILEPLRRVYGWLAGLVEPDGRLRCPEHGIEHTGKSACAAILAARLAVLDPGRAAAYRSFAVAQGKRLVANLVREGDSACHTFRPGRYDPFNNSNHVIDGGACSDALAELVQTFGPELAVEERDAFARASKLHAHSYLRYAVLDKGIPAQRAWGLTGLAQACSLEEEAAGRAVLEAAAIEAFGILEAIQHPDGSYPYHPLEWGAEHPGASDVSSFYQSRITAFLVFALERLNRDPSGSLFRKPLFRGLDFVTALQGPDGRKVGMVEAKPWYWGANYEVASHPFDVFALARGWRIFGRLSHADGAARAFRAWVRHLGPNGEPRSHDPGPGRGRSYQCPLFWAAHACWLARAAPDLEAILARSAPEPEPSAGRGLELAVMHFPYADLVRLEDGAVVAWVRGRRPPFNVHHGSPHGAGLVRCVAKADGRELIARCRLGGAQEGEWSGLGGPLTDVSPARGWRSGGAEVRFSLWLARVHWRAGRHLAAVRKPWQVFSDGVLAFGSRRVGSAFELAPSVRLLGDGVRLESRLARRSGEPLIDSNLERTFQVDGSGLVVTERLLDSGRARKVAYRVPAAATDVEVRPDQVSYRLAPPERPAPQA